MSKFYRIYTEATGPMRQIAINEVAAAFHAFTVIDCEGYWQGEREESMIIEIITDRPDFVISDVARRIRGVNGQDAVLVTATIISAQTVTKESV